MSLAATLAETILDRLRTITVLNGYNTNIGAKVFAGRRRLDQSHLPCAVLIERDDDVLDQSRAHDVKLSQKYVVEGHANCDPDNPNDAGHLLVADLKRALFTGKFLVEGIPAAIQIKYRGRSVAPREDGLNVVSASVEFAIEYVESLSNP